MKIFFCCFCFFIITVVAWGLDLNRVDSLLAGHNPEEAKRVLLEAYAQTANKTEEEQIQFLIA